MSTQIGEIVGFMSSHNPGTWTRVGLGIGLALAAVMTLWISVPACAAGSTWVSPLSGPVSVVNPFDPPSQPWLVGHRGIDLAAHPGMPVLAAGAGTVTFAGRVAGRPVMTVTHRELRTTYEPVAALLATGSVVRTGQIIGTLGVGGHCANQCLHWALLRGDVYLNPLSLLDRGPAVLKSLPPLGAAANSTPAPRGAPMINNRSARDNGSTESASTGSASTGSVPAGQSAPANNTSALIGTVAVAGVAGAGAYSIRSRRK